MKFRVVIEGLDPAPDRTLQSSGQYIEGCRIWAKSNLESLAGRPGVEAVIYSCEWKEVERIKPEGPAVELRDEVSKIISEIEHSTGRTLASGLTTQEICERLAMALSKTRA